LKIDAKKISAVFVLQKESGRPPPLSAQIVRMSPDYVFVPALLNAVGRTSEGTRYFKMEMKTLV
jgi:hypothetical protein